MKLGYYQKSVQRVNYYMIMVLAFAMPFGILSISYAISLWTLGTILEGNFKNKFRQNINSPANKLYLILFLVFYLFSLTGLLVNKNIEDVIPFLRVRLSLLLIPLLIALSNDLIRKNLRQVLLSFVLGILIASAYCYIGALINSIHIAGGSLSFSTHPSQSPWESYFLYDRFSTIMHPSYFAMYINTAIAILLSSFNRKEIFLTRKISLKVLIVAYLSITLFLLSSRANLLTWVLVFSYFFLIIGFEKFKVKKNLLAFYP